MWISGECHPAELWDGGLMGAYRGWEGPIAADHAIGGIASTPLKKKLL